MKKKLLKILFSAAGLYTFIFCVVGIIASFYFSSELQRMLNGLLKLEIYPPFVGGTVLHTIYDPVQDDAGSGSLLYPANSFYSPGNLDVVSYTVHEPVYHAPWQAVPEYWQLDFDFRTGFTDEKKPSYNRTISIYIDTDGNKKGSVKTLFENAELVQFSANHPWDYALTITGATGAVYTTNGKKLGDLEVLYSVNGKKMIVRIPLTKREMHHIYDAEKSWHYVCVGAYSPLDIGNLLPVSKRKTRTSGGGAVSRLEPKIYDIVCEHNQQDELSTWNDDTFEYALLEPVEIPMKGTQSIAAYELNDQKTLLEERAKSLALRVSTEKMQRYKALTQGDTITKSEQEELAILLFNLNKNTEAESLFTALLKTDVDNPTYRAYMGSIESMKGADASVIAAVAAVQSGYGFLDHAIELTAGTLEKAVQGIASEQEIQHRLNALINRGNCSKSVPNDVFIKAAQGAQDFLEAAELSRIQGNMVLYAQFSYNAGECYALNDEHKESQIWRREASRAIQKILQTPGGTSTETALPMNSEDTYTLISLQLKLMEDGLFSGK